MTDTPGSPVPAFARLSNQFLAQYGIVFVSDSGSPYVAVVSLGDGNNAIGSVDANGLLAYDAGFSVEFFLPSSPSVAAGTDRFSAGFNARGMIPRIAAIQGFDLDGNLITGNYFGTAEVGNEGTVGIGPLPSPPEDPLLFHSVRFMGGSLGEVAWDNFSFSQPVTPVPEPSVLVLGALGMALAYGGACRRRNKRLGICSVYSVNRHRRPAIRALHPEG
jgi:hypothetical protein